MSLYTDLAYAALSIAAQPTRTIRMITNERGAFSNSAKISGTVIALVFFLISAGAARAAVSTTLGTVKISVSVVGGTASASDFTLKIKRKSALDTGSISGNGDNVTFSALVPGTYVITTTGPSGYTTTWGGACNAQGEVTVGIGEVVTCSMKKTIATQGGGSGGGSGGGGGGTTPDNGGRSDRTPRLPPVRNTR